MLSAHEFATLMLVRNSADHIAEREELGTLLEQQLVALERLAGGAVRPRITEDGESLLRHLASSSIDERNPAGVPPQTLPPTDSLAVGLSATLPDGVGNVCHLHRVESSAWPLCGPAQRSCLLHPTRPPRKVRDCALRLCVPVQWPARRASAHDSHPPACPAQAVRCRLARRRPKPRRRSSAVSSFITSSRIALPLSKSASPPVGVTREMAIAVRQAGWRFAPMRSSNQRPR